MTGWVDICTAYCKSYLRPETTEHYCTRHVQSENTVTHREDQMRGNNMTIGLLHEVVVVMQTAEHRSFRDAVTGRQLVSVVIWRNTARAGLQQSRT